jgi:hypothetical protein
MTKLIFFVLLFISFTSRSSDLKSVSVKTDQILVMHFSDGTINYHVYHQKVQDELTVKDELEEKRASLLSSY